MSSHKLRLTLDAQPPKADGRNEVYIRYTYKRKSKRKGTQIMVFANHWDNKLQIIKTDFESKYDKKVISEIYDIKKKFGSAQVLLREKKISPTGAFEILIPTISIDGLLDDFIENNSKLTSGQKRKYKQYLSALENKHLTGAKFLVKGKLKIDSIGDVSVCNDIATILKQSSLSNNTVRDYLEMLDDLSRLAGCPVNSIFVGEKLLPKKTDPMPRLVQVKDLMLGINKINTLQDLESFLWWLYSFCLLGINTRDILNIDESCIVSDKSLDHYHPEAKFIPFWKDYERKAHVHIRRGKTKNPIVMLVNLFPTLVIRDWLHYIVGHTRPDLVYKGKDRFRIFNFKTLTKTGKPDEEGIKKQIKLLDTYADKQKKMFGGTTALTRQTVTTTGARIGISSDELKRQLGHKVKGAFAHYIVTEQVPKDVNHINIINEFGIIQILLTLMDSFDEIQKLDSNGNLIFTENGPMLEKSERTETLDSKEVPFNLDPFYFLAKIPVTSIPLDFKTGEFKDLKSGYNPVGEMLIRIDLTIWSRTDETRYQQLMEDLSKNSFKVVNGKVVEVVPSEANYPDELKELKAKKEAMYEELNKKTLKSYIKANPFILETQKEIKNRIAPNKVLDQAKKQLGILSDSKD